MRRFRLALIFILFLSSFAFALFFPVNLEAALALDENSNFQVLYPDSDYYQTGDNPVFSASNDKIAILNNETRLVTIFSETKSTFDVGNSDALVLFENYLFSEFNGEYTMFDLDGTNLSEPPFLIGLNYILFSNGTTLFAVTDQGEVHAFDKDLNELYSFSHSMLLSSKLCAFNDKLYAITYSMATNKFELYSFSYTTGLTVQKVLDRDENFTHFAVSDYITVANSTSKTLWIYDFNGIELKRLTVPFQFSAMSQVQNKSYFLVKNEKVVLSYDISIINEELQFSLNKIIGASHSGLNKLNKPQDALSLEDATYIADNLNNNVKIISNNGVVSVSLSAPKSLAKSTNAVYAATSNKVSKIEGGVIKKEYSLSVSENILSLTFADRLYALTNNGIYVLNDETFSKFVSIIDAKKIAVSSSQKLIYVQKNIGFSTFDLNGKEIALSGIDTADVVDFDVDYVGNIYAVTLSGNILECLRGANNVYTVSSKQLTHKEIEIGNITSVSIGYDGKIYFTSDLGYFAKTEIFCPVTEENFAPTLPPILNENTNISTYKANVATCFFLDPKNFEFSEIIQKDSTIVCFDLTPQNGFHYAIFGNRLGYVSLDDLTATQGSVPPVTDVKVLHQECNVYLYPLGLASTPSITLQKGTPLKIIDDVASFSNPLKWFKVSYDNNKIGYISATDVTDSDSSVMILGKAKYGKAKSSRIGDKVNIFALPDANSSVLESVADGTELQFIDDSQQGFVKVKYGGTVGYVFDFEFEKDGLTNSQLIAVILLIVSALVAVGIFFVTAKMKKKMND